MSVMCFFKPSFQSTPSAWRETCDVTVSDLGGVFQSTPSAWRETPLPPHGGRPGGISIHSLRMEGDFRLFHCNSSERISIHSLRMEGDLIYPLAFGYGFISIHSLRMEGDVVSICVHGTHVQFQSTPSAWRETLIQLATQLKEEISIHSLRMEGDTCTIQNSTQWEISIHSLRMEGDGLSAAYAALQNDFNPLPPHGGRHSQFHAFFRAVKFQSTPSAWRETLLIFVG